MNRVIGSIQAWFKSRFYSLPARIVRVFVVQTIITMILLAMVAIFSVQQEKKRVPQLMEDYLERIVADLPEQLTEGYLTQLHAETGLHFGYQEGEQWLVQTDHSIHHFEDEEIEDWRPFTNHSDWLWDFDQGYFAVIIPHNEGRLWVFVGFKRERDHDIGFWLSVLIIGLMLLATYLWVRKLVSPIRTLESGIRQYADGEFSHRLPVVGHNDLSNLSATVNTMAGQIENRLEKNRELFLAMSHELRTPLARLKVALEMLDDSERKTIMQRSQQDMEAMIDALLLREQLHFQQKSNQELVQAETLKQWLSTDFEADMARIHLEMTTQFSVETDSFALRVLLKNLLSNALKYSTETPVVLSIESTPSGFGFSVEDRGIGIADSELKHIFEPFYRVDQARSRQTGGHGLGLYLAQILARQLGASLNVESELGKGTRFYFEITAS